MYLTYIAVLTIILRSPLLGAVNCNITIFGGPVSQGLPCLFPFTYYGKKYDKCTTAYEVDGKPWCATRVSKTTRELRGESNDWGYCDPRCPFIDFYGTLFPNGTTTVGPPPIKPSHSFSNTNTPESTTTTPESTTTTPESTTTTPESTTSPPKKMTLTQIIYSIWNPSASGVWIPSSSRDECGLGITLGFILSGENANIGEFPFTALIGYESIGIKREYDYLCGGSLINRRYVLTAAHCHSEAKPISIVVLGELDTSKDPDCKGGCAPVQRFSRGLKVTTHPRYSVENNAAHNDIALIRLPRLAITIEQDLQTFVSPICLPVINQTNMEPNNLTVVGWGRSSYHTNNFGSKGIGNEILQKLDVQRVPHNVCCQHFRIHKEEHICAGGIEGQDSCNGDSGSPLFSQETNTSPMVLRGLVSFGTSHCGIKVPGVYTRVASYIDWIKSNLKP